MANSQVTFKSFGRIVDASIDIEEPIVFPDVEEVVKRFTYRLGIPAADEFRLEFFSSESDAEAGVNPLTDLDDFLSYEISPAVPIEDGDPDREYAGTVTLRRLRSSPYDAIYGKISICQPYPEAIDEKAKSITPLEPNKRPHIPTWEIR
ncbi:MAG: hypothetical protein OXN27_23370 [Candidatus Poribacteria bacterium]|nr:hypothetical protein [Candidatus Poribacteria bacterium]